MKEETLGWSEDAQKLLDDADVLDESELNRLAYLAEHPELTDPLFLFVKCDKRE